MKLLQWFGGSGNFLLGITRSVLVLLIGLQAISLSGLMDIETQLTTKSESKKDHALESLVGGQWYFDQATAGFENMPNSATVDFLNTELAGKLGGLPITDQASPQRNNTLLPMPNNSRRLCHRLDKNGQLAMEIHKVSLNTESMLGHWRAVGWQVAASPFYTTEKPAWHCQSNSQLIHVLLHTSPNRESATLMVLNQSIQGIDK